MVNPQVSIIGSSRASETEKRHAFTVGKLLARQNITLVCGGYGGVMAEACRGHREYDGGRTVGILKNTSLNEGNDHLDVKIATGVGEARNLAVVSSGQVVIAIGGSFGTLSELGYAKKLDKPVFGIGSWEHTRLQFPSDLDPEVAVNRTLEVLD
ncbi:MAG: TIGR00725 family protein [bacterium]